jgi:general secretion pathway protein L
MIQRLLSIDLQSDLLTAVLLSTGKSGEVLDSTIIITDGKEPEEIVHELTSSLDCTECRCYLALGASFFIFRNLTLPFSDRKSIDKILPFELEESIAGSIDNVLVDTIVNKGSGKEAEIIATMIERSLLGRYHTAFQEADITPERILLSGLPTISQILSNGEPPENFIFLSLRLTDATLFLFSEGKLQLVRPLSFKPLNFDAEPDTDFLYNEESGELTISGTEHSAEVYQELANSVKQTLAPLSLETEIQEMPLYIEGSGALVPSATSWIEQAFGVPCLVCGRGGLLPLPSQLPEKTEAHAAFLTSSLSLGAPREKSQPEFNFCKEEFVPYDNMAKYRTMGKLFAVILLASLISSLGYLFYDNGVLTKKRNALVSDINTVFKETLPGTKKIVDPRQQLQVAINAAKISSGEGEGTTLPYTALHVLREISTRITASMDVHLTRMVYEAKGLRLLGITDTFNTVDSMKKSLEQSAEISTVTISSTNMNPKDNKIRFELKLDLGVTEE